ncbi:MAG TPA: hypothetical protein VHN14_22410 [Kofleriaceae bacterium]|jgi:hypothetical protein|nr:hypothetical protein [Kofleriaceae bacterium]
MNRFVWVGALFASACGNATDDRPPTLEYITETILAPSCATAECHSAFKRQVGDVFDTVASTRRTIVANQLVAYPDDVADPAHSFLLTTLTVGSASILSPGSGNVRMPYDAPMPDADIRLIENWIGDGVPGAQCEPNAQNRGCMVRTIAGQTEYDVVECVGGNVGSVVTMCPAGQICTFYTGNGRCVAP